MEWDIEGRKGDERKVSKFYFRKNIKKSIRPQIWHVLGAMYVLLVNVLLAYFLPWLLE